MAGNEKQGTSQPSKSSRSLSTLTLPPRPFEALFSNISTGGGPGGLGFSPGPMTLISNYFSETDSDFKSFSQLLAGAMSPLAAADSGGNNRAGNLTITPPPHPPLFGMPQGLSPLGGLLDSPAAFAGLFSPQGHFGMTHQQALAQVTAQAALAQSNTQSQAENSLSVQSATETCSTQFLSFTDNSTLQQKMPLSLPDSKIGIKESSDIINSVHRSHNPSFAVDKPADDGYNWRKYGQKQVKGSEFPRSYYKCTHPNCPVKKKVERSLDGQVTEIIYKGQHSHQPPQPNKRGKDAKSLGGNSYSRANYDLDFQFQSGNASKMTDNREQEPGQATSENLSGMSDDEEAGETETGLDEHDEDEPDPKRRNTEVRLTGASSSHRTVTEPRIIVQTTSEVDLLDDGYRWRKYGQKVVKTNPYPRSYYKCTTSGCNVRKHIERAATDPGAVIATYEGKHNHDVPIAKNSGYNTSNASVSQVKPKNEEKQVLVNKKDFGSNDHQPIARLRLKEEQIT